MSLTVEAIDEDSPKTSWVAETYGICGWQGDPEALRRLALAPEFELEKEP